MNTESIQRRWDKFKAAVRQKWDKISDEEISVLRSNPSVLSHHLEARYGLSQDEATQHADAFFRDFSAKEFSDKVYPQNDGETERTSVPPDVNERVPPRPSQQRPEARF